MPARGLLSIADPATAALSLTAIRYPYITAPSRSITIQAATQRTAVARSRIRLPPDVTAKMETASGEVIGKKGPVFNTAIIAGIQAAKRTSELIPFCHPLPIDDCRVELDLRDGGKLIEVRCTMRVTHKTGVEMEAMVGASVAALTVYDMLKGLSHEIVIEETKLVSKTGGKRDFAAGGDG